VRADFSAFVARATKAAAYGAVVTGDRPQAEDLVQTALEKAYLRWHRSAHDPYGYVRGAVNATTNWVAAETWRERATRTCRTSRRADSTEETRGRDSCSARCRRDRGTSVVVLRTTGFPRSTGGVLGIAVAR